MKDLDSIKRREAVFDQLRETKEEYSQIATKVEELRNSERNTARQIQQLERLVNTMLKHDCCPTEAKLRYPEELEEPDYETSAMQGTNIASMKPITRRYK